MNWDGALTATIEVAIGIAGFAGIVAAIGRREQTRWSVTQQLQLQMLLTASASAGLFGFLPFLLLNLGLDSNIGWQIGSGLQLTWFVSILLFRQRQARRVGVPILGLLGRRWMAVYSLVAIALQIINVGWLGAFWPYMAGLLLQLATGFWSFVALLLATWPIDKATVSSSTDDR